MTGLILILCVFIVYRVTRLVTTDKISRGFRRRLAKRFPARPVPMWDPNGDQALIHNGESKEVEPAVTMEPHPLVEFVNCDPCISVWASAVAVFVAHACGLLDRWALVGFGWLGVAGAVLLIVEVVG